jgi:hypothetical protein
MNQFSIYHLLNQLVSQAFDIHGFTGREMLNALFSLGGTEKPSGAPGNCFVI